MAVRGRLGPKKGAPPCAAPCRAVPSRCGSRHECFMKAGSSQGSSGSGAARLISTPISNFQIRYEKHISRRGPARHSARGSLEAPPAVLEGLEPARALPFCGRLSYGPRGKLCIKALNPKWGSAYIFLPVAGDERRLWHWRRFGILSATGDSHTHTHTHSPTQVRTHTHADARAHTPAHCRRYFGARAGQPFPAFPRVLFDQRGL